MVLILGSKSLTDSVDEVVEWIKIKKVPFLRINIDDFSNGNIWVNISKNKGNVFYKNINLNEVVKVIWYSGLEIKINPFRETKKQFNRQEIQAIEEIQDEMVDLINYFCYSLKDKTWYPHYTAVKNNKLVTLQIAVECGLMIPDTKILSSKDEVITFLNKKETLIIKPIYFLGYYTEKQNGYTAYTQRVDSELLRNMPDNFFPCQFQEEVNSDYELRITFIENDMYACAWYNNGKKNVDKKLNSSSQFNHYLTFSIPEVLKKKIRKFMKKMNLSIGTIDILKNKIGYHFLEVNPCGRFLFESTVGNFYLEKIFAEYMVQKCKDLNLRESTNNKIYLA